MKLIRPKIYVGKEKATKHVIYLAKALKIMVPKPKKFGEDIILKTEKKDFRINFKEEIEHTQNIGKANLIQKIDFFNQLLKCPSLETCQGLN